MDRPAYCLPDEAEFMARGWWRDEDTLWEWLQRHARTRADQPAVVSSGGAILFLLSLAGFERATEPTTDPGRSQKALLRKLF